MTTMTMTTTEATSNSPKVSETIKAQIPDRMFFRIGDVADIVDVKPYVLRFWESEFPIVSPQKSATGQRVYRRSDVENLLLIKHLLYEQRFSIEGAKKRLRELRAEGELKQARQEVTAPQTDPRIEEKFKKTQQGLQELQVLVATPIEKLFLY